jgi:hypothetical protein
MNDGTFTDPCEALAGRNYQTPDDAELENLGVMYATGTGMRSAVGTTYLRVLVTCIKAETPPDAEPDVIVWAISRAAGTLSHPIIRGLGLGAVSALERNRRSNFLRTQTTAFRKYVEYGGSLADLDPSGVTKEILTELTAAIITSKAAEDAAAVSVDGVPVSSAITTAEYGARREANRAFRRMRKALRRLPADQSRQAAEVFVATITSEFIPSGESAS